MISHKIFFAVCLFDQSTTEHITRLQRVTVNAERSAVFRNVVKMIFFAFIYFRKTQLIFLEARS